MRLDTYAKIVATQYLSDNELAVIRQFTTKMLETERDHPFGIYSMRMLNHINLITADNAMVDVMALQEKLDDRETRLRAMEKAYFEMVVEKDWLREKLNSLGVKV